MLVLYIPGFGITYHIEMVEHRWLSRTKEYTIQLYHDAVRNLFTVTELYESGFAHFWRFVPGRFQK
jgi:hypothetical protein